MTLLDSAIPFESLMRGFPGIRWRRIHSPGMTVQAESVSDMRDLSAGEGALLTLARLSGQMRLEQGPFPKTPSLKTLKIHLASTA